MNAYNPPVRLQTAWQDTPEARRILASLTPSDVIIVARTPVVGPRYNEWVAPDHDETLYELRRAFIAAAFGKPYAACTTDDECRAYLEFDARHENVAEVLRAMFGTPDRYGRATHRLIDCDRAVEANAAHRRQTAYEGEIAELRAMEGAIESFNAVARRRVGRR